MWEVQYHPASIRGRVRFFFLSRTHLRRLTAAALAGFAVVAASIALAPTGVRSIALLSRTLVARHENRVERALLARQEETLRQLEERLRTARRVEEQIALVLGVAQHDSGIGGYPAARPEGFDEPAALAALERAALLETESTALLTLAKELADFAKRNAALTRQVPSICPLPSGSFVLSSPYGERVSPFTRALDFHTGIDLAAREGTPVVAAGDGTVVFAGRIPIDHNVHWWRYGNLVVLAHGARYLSIYAHLRDVAVRTGESVRRGDVVGSTGNTGWSTSPHLHYEVRVAEQEGSELVPMDPRIFVLNYRWKEQEAALVASRKAPRPPFDPLPATVRLR